MLHSAVSGLLRWDCLCNITAIARCRLEAQKGPLYDNACVRSEYTNGHQTAIDEWLFSGTCCTCIWCLDVLICCAGLSDRVFRCSGSHHITRDIPRDMSPGVVPADVAKVVAADAACLADAGILFPADPVGTLSPTDQDGTLSPTDIAGILFPADPDGVVAVGVAALAVADPTSMAVAGLAVAGILFPADPVGTLSPTDQDGTLFTTDFAGILFPADPVGTLSPTDLAGILFPADFAELITVGVAGVAVTGTAPLAVPYVFTEPELVTMIVTDEVETVDGNPVDHGGDCDDSDCKDIRNGFETVDGVPACVTVVMLTILVVRNPGILWRGVGGMV